MKRMMVRELTLYELIFTLLTMLLGEEGKAFSYYENDLEWWELRLRTRLN